MPCGHAIVAVYGMGTAKNESRPTAATRRRAKREHQVVHDSLASRGHGTRQVLQA